MRAAADSHSVALVGSWKEHPPEALLLVDRAGLVDRFLDAGVLDAHASPRLAVVSADGEPRAIVTWLGERFRSGARLPVLYVHDAACVLYPFAIEPVATLVARRGSERFAYVDLGLPPLGTTARRFRDPALSPEAIVTKLEELAPDALVRYVVDAARRLVSGASAARLTPRAAPRRAP